MPPIEGLVTLEASMRCASACCPKCGHILRLGAAGPFPEGGPTVAVFRCWCRTVRFVLGADGSIEKKVQAAIPKCDTIRVSYFVPLENDDQEETEDAR